MTRSVVKCAGVLGLLGLAACATDNPTDVGGQLLSSGDLVTFEVNLPTSSFLAYDTSFSGYAKARDANFGLIAQKFENTVDAHLLVRMSLPPASITVRTTGSTTATDTLPKYFAGRMVLKLDTLTVPAVSPVKLSLYHTAENWDGSATWTNRVDTLNAHVPWTTAGGTRGARIDTTTWAGGDSIVFNVDSASLATWADSSNHSRGAIIASETDGARLKIIATAVHVSAHSTLRADTVVNVDLVPTERTFVFTPELPPATSDVRVGGIPAWRAILRLRPDLLGMTFPCGNGVAGCTVPLDSAHISAAEILFTPIKSPPGFSLEDSTVIDVRTLALSSTVPLERSALGSHLSYSKILEPGTFNSPTPGSLVKIDITGFLTHLTNPNTKPEDKLPPILTLLQVPEPSTFGFVAFASNPTLRLVLTSTVARQP